MGDCRDGLGRLRDLRLGSKVSGRRTRAVYATGSDLEAARLAGIRPRRVVFGVFAMMGVLTGLAAMLGAMQMPASTPTPGTGWNCK